MGRALGQSTKQKKARAQSELRHLILTQQLAPGADLDEMSLSERWSLSRTPLRDVLRQLAGEGYVDIRENRGARVAEMSQGSLRDFFLAAPMIYSAVLQLAAQNASATQIAALKVAQTAFKEALKGRDIATRALANTKFHEITGEMAGNTYLTPSFNRLLIDHTRISMAFFRPSDAQALEHLEKASDQHDHIIASIEKGDVKTAGSLAIKHWTLSRDRIEQCLLPKALDPGLDIA